jgi:quinolinate synthase
MGANQELIEKIIRLKADKNAVILAHYYQTPDIQDVGDFVGDSLDLSRKAAATSADIIVFAGVHFMAETAKILNPGKKVLLPDLEAGCSLSQSCPPDHFRNFLQQHPHHKVVSYINCSAEIKAMSDLICTSANARAMVNYFDPAQPLIFAPDKNLGRYIARETGRPLTLWEGACVVHEAFSIEKLLDLARQFPEAEIIAHPESEAHILKVAHFIGSTAAMLRHVQVSSASTFLVATEAGILHEMTQKAPGKTFIPVPTHQDNTCACSECAFMKVNTLEKLYRCLRDESPEIHLEASLREKALSPLQRMLELSEGL